MHPLMFSALGTCLEKTGHLEKLSKLNWDLDPPGSADSKIPGMALRYGAPIAVGIGGTLMAQKGYDALKKGLEVQRQEKAMRRAQGGGGLFG